MITDTWIQNLASWQWQTEKRQWDHSPKANPQSLYLSFQKLLDLCRRACTSFNQHSHSEKKKMQYMAGPPEPAMDSGSFALLLGRCDARVSLSSSILKVEVATAESFSRTITFTESFSVHTGELAEIFWKQSDGFLYTEELISMLMLEELVKTWWNYQGSKLKKSKSRKDSAREYHL
ncbi:MAG: hypothetical protein HRU09_09530 [Oligoflexales bacterium]|nr:hypothetical protein [Oligoflexales bacterium]